MKNSRQTIISSWKRHGFYLIIFITVVLIFRDYLPLEKGGALHLKRLESSLPKDALCQAWLNLGHYTNTLTI